MKMSINDFFYKVLTRIYGSEEKWLNSRLRNFERTIYLHTKDSKLWSSRMMGIVHEQSRRNVVGEPQMNLLQQIFFFIKQSRYKLPMMECSIGMTCTLKCKNCNQVNYRLNNKTYFPIDEIIRNMSRILQSIDYIYEVSIAGGEAFGHPNLYKLVRYLAAHEKVGYVVIVTNGTICPGSKLVEAMKSRKVELSVSNYPLKDTSIREEMYRICREEGVRIRNNNEDSTWADFGPVAPRGYKKHEMIDAYTGCWLKDVLCMIDGKVYRCEKTYVLENLGLQEADSREYVDVRTGNKKQIRQQIGKLYDIKYVNACNYCSPMQNRAVIPSGIQVEE